MEFFEKEAKFRKRLEQLPREDLLDIIRAQDVDLIKQIRRIEYVFDKNLQHLTWKDGTPIGDGPGMRNRPMTNQELALLIDEPFEVDKELSQMGLGVADQQRIHIAKDPVMWAKHVLNAKPRVYQILMLRHPQRFKVLRAGRRLGKTFTMAVLLLHYCYTTKNGKCLVLTPMKAQAGLIYEEMMKLSEESAIVSDAITRNVTAPQYEIDFTNGSSCRFFTSGESSGGKSAVTRGQEAHIIVLDEMDYMADDSLDALIAMLQKTDENQAPKRLIGASTPTGRRGKFWEWCTGVTKKQDGSTNKDPRFKEFWFPSYCHPLWDRDMEELMHEQHSTEMSYRHEVEADWGEDAQGVYPRRFVDLAFQDDWRYIPELTSAQTKYFIGVDWDKIGAGTNIVVVEMFPRDFENPDLRNKIRVCHREEVPKGEYTLTNAVDRVIELNKRFRPEYIYVDRGYGDTQIELLHKYGMDNPNSALHRKVKGIHFRNNIEIRDPWTQQKEKKPAKHFMIDNLKVMLEKGEILFPKSDPDLYLQLISFIVVSRSSMDEPKYGMSSDSIPDHAHDALILALLAVTENYGDLLRVNYATKVIPISNITFLPTQPKIEAKKADPDEPESVQKAPPRKVTHATSAQPFQLKRAMTPNSRGRPIKRRMF